MKTCLIVMLGCWMAMVCEQTRPDALPAGSVLIPMVAALIFWLRNATGVLLGGVALIIDWIARPNGLPLMPMILPVAAVLLIRQSWPGAQFKYRRVMMRLPTWTQPLVLTATAVMLQMSSTLASFNGSLSLTAVADCLPEYTVTAFVLSAAAGFIIQFCDAMGIRRRPGYV